MSKLALSARPDPLLGPLFGKPPAGTARRLGPLRGEVRIKARVAIALRNAKGQLLQMADIRRVTGLNAQQVSASLAKLEREGWAVKEDSPELGVGRKSYRWIRHDEIDVCCSDSSSAADRATA